MSFIINNKEYKLIKNKVIVKGGNERPVYYFVAKDSKLKAGGREIEKIPKGYSIKCLERCHNYPVLSKDRL